MISPGRQLSLGQAHKRKKMKLLLPLKFVAVLNVPKKNRTGPESELECVIPSHHKQRTMERTSPQTTPRKTTSTITIAKNNNKQTTGNTTSPIQNSANNIALESHQRCKPWKRQKRYKQRPIHRVIACEYEIICWLWPIDPS